jgi:site-specific DNA recombinase
MTNRITPPTVHHTPGGSTPDKEAQHMTSLPQTPKRVVLYARVSTDEQARRGFSLAQQLESLREYAAREGYEVIKEVSDPGQSGAYLERPGLDRVRDLVEAGGVSAVFAQDADRITRDPAHRAFLDEEFERFGTRLFALDDWGDDTHEGELLRYLKGWVSKGERLKTAERTRRGKKRKAREGKIVAPRKVAYGFALNEARDAYVVDEEKMAVVRRVFDHVAGGASLHAVKKMLEAEGVQAPSGGVHWSRSTLRAMISSDLYFPYTFEEVAALVAPAVAAGLNPSVSYGIWWSSRYDIRMLGRTRTAEGDYVERHSHGLKQREEWIAVPVPDAEIPREVAERARRNLEYNFRRTSKGRRTWELSGGLLSCGECGRRMATNTIAPAGRTKRYHYYLCPRKAEENWSDCPNKNHRAEALEERVQEAVSQLFRDPQAIEEQVERRLDRERTMMRDPEKEALNWAKRITEIATKRGRYQD